MEPFLCHVLISKVPTDLELLVRRKVPESEWKLTTLLTTIEEEIIARERLSQSKPPRRSERKSPSTATTLHGDQGFTLWNHTMLLLQSATPSD